MLLLLHLFVLRDLLLLILFLILLATLVAHACSFSAIEDLKSGSLHDSAFAIRANRRTTVAFDAIHRRRTPNSLCANSPYAGSATRAFQGLLAVFFRLPLERRDLVA